MLASIRNVSMRFDEPGGARYVLRGATLDMAEHEFISLTGPAGTGKSTVLNMIAGICRPTSGYVFFRGRNVYALNSRQRARMRLADIGFLYQSQRLIHELTAWENITLPLRMTNKRVDKAYLNGVTDMLAVGSCLHDYPAQLNGSQQMRVTIARALAARPDLLLADDPTANLELDLADEVLALLSDIHRNFRCGILLVTQDPDIAQCAQTGYTIDNGSIVTAWRQ